MNHLPSKIKEEVIASYSQSLTQHGGGPEAAQWSPEGQNFRFLRLIGVGDLNGASILDLGCNIGDFYPFLKSRFRNIRYTGVDIVPATIELAQKKYGDAEFFCQDILDKPLGKKFDFVFISGLFNNECYQDSEAVHPILRAAFHRAQKGLAFNFLSNRANFFSKGLAYHDPVQMAGFCLSLSRQVQLFNHYERCDSAIYLYPEESPA